MSSVRSAVDRIENALEWLLGDDTHAVDFCIVVVVATTFVYFTWQVIRWAR